MQVAITEVDQSFFNPNPQRLEGDYLFPIPKGAQIDKFSMDINGKLTKPNCWMPKKPVLFTKTSCAG